VFESDGDAAEAIDGGWAAIAKAAVGASVQAARMSSVFVRTGPLIG